MQEYGCRILRIALVRGIWSGSQTSTQGGAEDSSVDRVDEEFGKLNSNAPADLARFAFLVGGWREV